MFQSYGTDGRNLLCFNRMEHLGAQMFHSELLGAQKFHTIDRQFLNCAPPWPNVPNGGERLPYSTQYNTTLMMMNASPVCFFHSKGKHAIPSYRALTFFGPFVVPIVVAPLVDGSSATCVRTSFLPCLFACLLVALRGKKTVDEIK